MDTNDIMGRPLILAVDNAPMFLDTLKKLLANEPYNLHCESTGDGAMTFLQSARPSLILLDVEMPDIDGYSLARRMKGSGQSAPILIVTANNEKKYEDMAIEAGAVGILHKPLRHDGLMAAIKKYVK